VTHRSRSLTRKSSPRCHQASKGSSLRNLALAVASCLALLATAMPAAGSPGTLRGRVTDRSARPIARAVISPVEAGLAPTVMTVMTDGDGSFVLELPPDVPLPFELAVSARGYETVTLTVRDPDASMLVSLPERALFSGEVEVTGTRAEAGETPITLTNISREEIERGSWGQDVPAFLLSVPGFYAYNDNGNDIGYSYFFLRGFDMRRTAVTLNGVPLNDATSHGVFFIDHADFLATTGDIQVQRGVGTNLYGGSAIGGSVDLRTRHPLAERRLRFSAMNGSWDTSRWSLQYDTGLLDESWAATFRWSRIDSDGYRDQAWTEMWSYYGALEHYGERSTTRLVLFGGPEDTHLAYSGVSRAYLDGEITGEERRDRRYNPLTYPQEVDHFFQPHYQLSSTFQLSDDLVLSSTLFYFQGDGYFEQLRQGRWLPEYGLEPFEGPGGELVDTTDLVRRRQVKEWDGGWIPTLEWSHADGRGTLNGGASIRLHRSHHWGEVRWAEHYPPGVPPNHRYYDYESGKRTLQPFLQETWRFNDQWTLLAGITWTSHRYQLDQDRRNDISFAETFSYLLPRLGLTFKPAEGWSVYGNISRGGREPAFRDIYDPQDYWSHRTKLEEERLTDYELGLERRWADAYARVNLYWMDFSNEIVWAGGLDDLGEPITANGAVTDHRGIELEAAWSPLPRFSGRLSVAYADNTIEQLTLFDYDGSSTDLSGNRIAGSPDWLASLQLGWGLGPVDGLLTVRHVGRFYLDNTENLRKQPALRDDPGFVDRINTAHTILDLSAHIDLGTRLAELLQARQVRLELRINNLTDELYTSFGYMDWPEPLWIPAATRSIYTGLTFDW